MNTKIITIALALALPLTVAAFPGGKDGEHVGGHRGDKLERLVNNLALSAEQKSKLDVLFKAQHEKREALRQEMRLGMQDVLSPEQITQLDEMKKKRAEQWQKRHEERKHKKSAETEQ